MDLSAVCRMVWRLKDGAVHSVQGIPGAGFLGVWTPSEHEIQCESWYLWHVSLLTTKLCLLLCVWMRVSFCIIYSDLIFMNEVHLIFIHLTDQFMEWLFSHHTIFVGIKLK
jgi:hypothetical protein